MSQSLRICHIVSHVDEEASGPSYTVPRLCIALAQSGASVTLATLANRKPRSHIDKVNHVQFQQKAWSKRLGISPDMRKWLNDNAKEFDIIHSHGMWMMPNIYPANASQMHQTPHVISPRGTLGKEALHYSRNVKRLF